MATTNIPTGNRNAEKPQNWKNRSADMRADRADPVARWPGRQRRGDIERGVVRRIGKQAQRQQHRQAQPHEADHFVEAFVFGWCKNAHKLLPGPGESLSGIGEKCIVPATMPLQHSTGEIF